MHNASTPLIDVKNLDFAYRRKPVLKDVSFTVQEGDFFCCLGPNGAGKSTIVKLLTGRLKPAEDRAWVMGNDIAQPHSQVIPRIGILTDDMALPQGLTVEEVLSFTARAFGHSRRTALQLSDGVIAQVQMGEYRKVQIRHLSTGLERRVEVGQALINQSQLLFLDEPTISLDPIASHEIRQLIKQIHKEGATIFYTTHLLHEVAELGTRILVVDDGEVALSSDLQKLQRGKFVKVDFDGEDELAQGIEVISGLNFDWQRQGRSVLIPLEDEGGYQQVMDETLEMLQARQVKIMGISFYQENLEEAYRRIVGVRDGI